MYTSTSTFLRPKEPMLINLQRGHNLPPDLELSRAVYAHSKPLHTETGCPALTRKGKEVESRILSGTVSAPLITAGAAGCS